MSEDRVDMATYKGFKPIVTFEDGQFFGESSSEDGCLFLTFRGKTLEEAEKEFHASVDEFSQWINETNTT